MRWNTVTIVGVGLIGGSLGLALRERALAERVIGVGRRVASLRAARKRGAVTEWTTDLARGVSDADLVVVCSPVNTIVPHVVACLAHAPRRAVVTDAGSTKQAIVAGVRNAVPSPRRDRFIGSHPIAGGERSGPTAARADLFQGKCVILTPHRGAPAEILGEVVALWEEVGGRVEQMSPARHDQILAGSSHAPHVVAAALAAATRGTDLPFTGSGWADTTRIAAGDPDLWLPILRQNRGHVLKSLAKFAKVLAQFQSALERDDPAALKRLLQAGKKQRDAVGS